MRWNKVVVLDHVLHKSQDDQVLIWVDSDLVINDLKFSFVTLLKEHPSSDILISAEVNPKNAGESNFIRKHVFCSALEKYQALFPLGLDLRKDECQRDKEDLDAVDYIYLHQLEWEAINTTTYMLWRNTSTEALFPMHTSVITSTLQALRYRARDVQQSASKVVSVYMLPKATSSFTPNGDHAPSKTIKSLFSHVANDVLYAIYKIYRTAVDAALSTSDDVSQHVGLIQSTLDSGLEFLLVCIHLDQYTLVIGQLEEYIDNLLMPASASALHPSSMPTLYYYKFKILEFKANYMQAHPTIFPASPYLLSPIYVYVEAWHVWLKLYSEFYYFGAGNTLMNSYEEGVKVGLTILNIVIHGTYAKLSRHAYDGVVSVVVILQDILLSGRASQVSEDDKERFLTAISEVVSRKMLEPHDVAKFFSEQLKQIIGVQRSGENGFYSDLQLCSGANVEAKDCIDSNNSARLVRKKMKRKITKV
eukprot:gene27681-33430_t